MAFFNRDQLQGEVKKNEECDSYPLIGVVDGPID